MSEIPIGPIERAARERIQSIPRNGVGGPARNRFTNDEETAIASERQAARFAHRLANETPLERHNRESHEKTNAALKAHNEAHKAQEAAKAQAREQERQARLDAAIKAKAAAEKRKAEDQLIAQHQNSGAPGKIG